MNSSCDTSINVKLELTEMLLESVMCTVTGSVRLSILFTPATRAPMTGDRISLPGGMPLAMGNRTGSPYTENTRPTSSMSSLILLKRLRGSWMEAIITRLSSTSSVAGAKFKSGMKQIDVDYAAKNCGLIVIIYPHLMT